MSKWSINDFAQEIEFHAEQMSEIYKLLAQVINSPQDEQNAGKIRTAELLHNQSERRMREMAQKLFRGEYTDLRDEEIAWLRSVIERLPSELAKNE